MTRDQQIKELGIELVEAKEVYWQQKGYIIDYDNDLLIKIEDN